MTDWSNFTDADLLAEAMSNPDATVAGEASAEWHRRLWELMKRPARIEEP